MVESNDDVARMTVERLASSLLLNPDVAAISLDDPRLRWLRTRFKAPMPASGTLGDLVRSASLRMLPDPPTLIEVLEHLIEYTNELASEMLEIELQDIVDRLVSASHADAMVARLGWAGSPPVTLHEASQISGVTRERIRQLENRLIETVAKQPVWTPVLDRALNVVTRRAPLANAEVGALLRAAKLSRHDTFDAEGLVAAQRIFGKPDRLHVQKRLGAIYLTLSSGAGSDAYPNQRDDQPEVTPSVNGESEPDQADVAATIEPPPAGPRQSVEQAPELTGSALSGSLRRMVAVYSPLPLRIARLQLQRQVPELASVTDAEIIAAVADDSALRVVDTRIVTNLDFRLEIEDELTATEFLVYKALRDAGSALRDEVIPKWISGGSRVEAVERKRLLRESSVIVRLNDGRYDAFQDSRRVNEFFRNLADLDLATQAEPAAQLVEDDSPVAANTPIEPAASGEEPDDEFSDQLESPAVRKRISGEFYRLAHGTGLAHVTELVRDLNAQRIVQVSNAQLRPMLKRIDDLVELSDGWITTTASRDKSPLTKFLRRMLAVYPTGLPLDLATAQLKRQKTAYVTLAESDVAVFVQYHTEFDLRDDRIFARHGTEFHERDELSRDERVIHEAIIRARKPLTERGIAVHTHYGAMISPTRLKIELRESCVLVPLRDGTFEALQPSSRLRALVLSTDPTTNLSASPSIVVVTQPSKTPLKEALPTAVVSSTTANASRHVDTAVAIADQPDTIAAIARPHTSVVDQEHGRTSTELWSLAEIITKVRGNQLVLPEIQRGYVWKPAQVRDLVDSLYRGFPIGTMLVWITQEELRARAVGEASRSPGVPVGDSTNYLLDGQQRITSISKVLNGDLNLLFNPIKEEFATATSTNLRSRFFVPVADVWRAGGDDAMTKLAEHLPLEEHDDARHRLLRLEAVLGRSVSVDLLHNFSYEEVTNIFVRVNSRGTRLKAAELAIAQIAQRLPNMISDDVAVYAAKLQAQGWQFDDQFLLRCLTAVARNRSSFKHLVSLHRADVMEAWQRLIPAMDYWLELLRDRLGIESMDFIQSINSHVVPVAWIGSNRKDLYEDTLLEWFVLSLVGSRYSDGTGSALDADLQRLLGASSGNPFPVLIQNLRLGNQANRIVDKDLERATRSSSLRLLLFLAARNTGARDLFTGKQIESTDSGDGTSLVMQQIFPLPAVRGHVLRSEVNELTNYVLLVRDPNAAPPTIDIFRHLGNVTETRLVDLAIPTNPDLWRPDQYREFIRERRRLLVAQMNEALASLSSKGPLGPDNSAAAQEDEPRHIAEPPSPYSVRSNAREPKFADDFAGLARNTYSEMVREILALDPNVSERANAVYYSYSTMRGSTTRPFATLARRKNVLVWTIDAKVDQLVDPRGWCNDMSELGKHGIGNAQFKMTDGSEIDYALSLVRQSYRRAIGEKVDSSQIDS